MSAMNEREQIKQLGLRTFPLIGKCPQAGFHWKEWAAIQVCRTGCYGILCDKIAVADTDTREKAVWWWENRERTPWMVRTPRGGVHFYYQGNPDLPNGQYGDWDLRAGGKGYVCGPDSIRGGIRYELVGQITLDLPLFDPSWLPESSKETGKPLERVVEPGEDIVVRIKRARGFMRKIVSVSGSGTGDRELFRAASALIQKFDIPEVVALEELRRWNQTNAKPPWPDSRLRYKIEQAIKNVG